MITTTNTTEDLYDRAVRAEPQLRAVERIVDALVDLVRPGDTLCTGCVWESIIKPLTAPWIGWERGYPPEQATDADDQSSWGVAMELREFLSNMPQRAEPTTETERWLRTPEAFDAFTDRLLSRLDSADPANGHGFGRCNQ